MIYLILNLVFSAIILLFGWLALRVHFVKPNQRALLITLVIVLLSTAIFDSLIILMDIVNYNPDTLLGIYIWLAPIEDFSYATVAALGAPILWHNLKVNKKGETNDKADR